MDLEEIKIKLLEVQKKVSELDKKYYIELQALKDDERSVILEYLRTKAKFQEGDCVRHRGRICYIGWRQLNKEDWKIYYRTLSIKKDGQPGAQLSSYARPEEEFELYKSEKK